MIPKENMDEQEYMIAQILSARSEAEIEEFISGLLGVLKFDGRGSTEEQLQYLSNKKLCKVYIWAKATTGIIDLLKGE